jgi:hypothetical protein
MIGKTLGGFGCSWRLGAVAPALLAVAWLALGGAWLDRPPRAQEIDRAIDDPIVLPLLNRALETEQSEIETQWSNPATGHRGTITVLRTLPEQEGRPCRAYRRTVRAEGADALVIEGTGCRVARGVWQLEEAPLNVAAPAASAAPPNCPALDPGVVVRVPCARPAAFVDYTMPAKAER